jgi:hypothetical protein
MSARVLLDELDAAGVRLFLAADDLRYQTRPGVSIAPYRERITAEKPALMAELLKQRIIDVVTVDPATFDRAGYERLWALWETYGGDGGVSHPIDRMGVPMSDVSLARPDRDNADPIDADALLPPLDEGWDWLVCHPEHPEHEAFLDRWISRLRDYERAHAAQCRIGERR